MSPTSENLVCRKIIQALPYILFNDDFNDRPVSSISLDEKNKDSWYDIFERVFNSTDKGYTLKSIMDNDERIRKSILSDVECFLGNTLTEAWSKFSPEKKQISISLGLETENNSLEIYIKEQPKGMPERYFKITDRSKGFIWYYNFIMKIRFNPKQTAGVQKETIFLLDEPGSYLHETAQADLCKKLSDISKKEGFVIYCTHSPQLLLPRIIPINSILIVEKQKGTDIGVTPVSIKNDTNSKRKTAMQPIYEALQLPEYEMVESEKKILCVEGIYDKYCIESFCTIAPDIRLFPSVSAGSIVQNIPYFIAFQKQYMALWDNDPEGRKKHKQAREHFGEIESKKFELLPDIQSKGKVIMEDMIATSDYDLLRNILNLPDDADYNAIVSTLYFLSKPKMSDVVKMVSVETKNNFTALQSVIEKHLCDDKGVTRNI
jgi:predicted ATP-dependent endonuclease of OLD family